jgi:hypothetical protein
MFADIFADLRGAVDEMRYGAKVRTITVAKPYCAPARDAVMTALKPYGVKIYNYHEAERMVSPRTVLKMSKSFADYVDSMPGTLPVATVATVTVSAEAAAWAEYLLIRSGKLYRVGPYINRRNAEWAGKHGGQMPPAWHEGKPWIETSCRAGMDAWQKVKDAAKQKKGRGS